MPRHYTVTMRAMAAIVMYRIADPVAMLLCCDGGGGQMKGGLFLYRNTPKIQTYVHTDTTFKLY